MKINFFLEIIILLLKMKKSIVIVGGGITGLVSAFIAAKNNYNVTVVDTSNKFGGLLNTFKINQTNLEYYYHHYFQHDTELKWLLKSLKIEKNLFFKKTQMGMYSENQIYNFNNISDLLKYKPLSFISKIKFLVTTLFLGKFISHFKYENIPAVNWLQKWAGKQVTENIWEPLLRVKFGKHYNKIPLTWLVGRIKQRFYSRRNGDEALGYLHGSTQLILDKIIKQLLRKKVKLIKNAKITTIKNGELLDIKINKKIFKNTKILFTCPNAGIIKALGKNNPNLTKQLKKIKYLGALCVIFKMKKNFSDIYWMNIADSKALFGGIIEHTNLVDKKNYKNEHIIYLSKYFDNKENLFKKNKKELFKISKKFLKKINPSFNEKVIKDYYIFSSNQAEILNDLNFSKKILKFNSEIKNVYISNMMHIYPEERSINNSIRVATNACQKIGMNVDNIPSGISKSGLVGF